MEEKQINMLDRIVNKFEAYSNEVKANQEKIIKEIDNLFW